MMSGNDALVLIVVVVAVAVIALAKDEVVAGFNLAGKGAFFFRAKDPQGKRKKTKRFGQNADGKRDSR